ncbi:MAG: type II toxin-antitoxin system VapC family toxin [Proteobacteria bacterium]|nr:type II toxin-antitoxin system VapC family toxin [Pseudomonadota bacterium]
MIIVDTNIIAYLYITGERTSQAEQLLTQFPHWNAPVLWRSEFRNVLSLYLRNQILQVDDVLLILQQADELLHGNEYQVPSTRIMQLVSTSICSAYDCEFVALAQYLDLPLVTADKKILREFPNIAMSLDTFLG